MKKTLCLILTGLLLFLTGCAAETVSPTAGVRREDNLEGVWVCEEDKTAYEFLANGNVVVYHFSKEVEKTYNGDYKSISSCYISNTYENYITTKYNTLYFYDSENKIIKELAFDYTIEKNELHLKNIKYGKRIEPKQMDQEIEYGKPKEEEMIYKKVDCSAQQYFTEHYMDK